LGEARKAEKKGTRNTVTLVVTGLEEEDEWRLGSAACRAPVEDDGEDEEREGLHEQHEHRLLRPHQLA
jgi:hypothetical protein